MMWKSHHNVNEVQQCRGVRGVLQSRDTGTDTQQDTQDTPDTEIFFWKEIFNGSRLLCAQLSCSIFQERI
jgi:hypothetical protein